MTTEGLKPCPFPKTVYLASPHIQQNINGHEQTIGMFLTDKPVGGDAYEYTRADDELIDKLVGSLKRLAYAGQMLNQGKPVRDLDEIYGEAGEALGLADKWRKG